MMEEWLSALHSGNQVGLLLVDLCKAFDLVNHDILLKKLKLYKCTDKTLNWFSSYINDRKQSVSIKDTLSGPMPVNCGVPQGSILGPLLFILFINDIFLEDHLNEICLFADDAVIKKSGLNKNEIRKKLQPCANSTQAWCLKNRMVLSIEKTNTLYICSKQKHEKQAADNANLVKIGEHELDEVENAKLLGVFIDNTLSWEKQIGQVKKNVSYKLSLLRRIRKYLPFETRILFYNYYIKPIIEYCCIIWGKGSKDNDTIVTKLQKKAARLILDADPLTPSKVMFKQLNWLPFNDIVKFKQACLIYKSKTGQAPEYIQNMFTNVSDRVTYSLRSASHDKLYLPRNHPKSLSFSGVNIWNTIPDNIRNAETLSSFKIKYNNLLIEQSYYNS